MPASVFQRHCATGKASIKHDLLVANTPGEQSAAKLGRPRGSIPSVQGIGCDGIIVLAHAVLPGKPIRMQLFTDIPRVIVISRWFGIIPRPYSSGRPWRIPQFPSHDSA
jgi:hypothetical protein